MAGQVAGLAASLSTALSPRAVRTCAAYGLDKEALTFAVTLPRLVTNDVQKLVTTTVTNAPMGSADPRTRLGMRFLERAGEVYRHRKGTGPALSRSGRADLIVSGSLLALAAAAAAHEAYRRRQAERSPAPAALTGLHVAPEEMERLVETIRAQLARQLAARAEEVERFLA